MSFTSRQRRDLTLVVTAKAVSWLGDEVAMISLTLVLQASGRGALAVAELLIANAVPMVALAAPVGRAVDRIDNRVLLAFSTGAQAAVCLVLAFASSVPLVLVLVALLGAGQSVTAAGWTALTPSIVDPENLAKAVGRSQAGVTLAGIAAPALGGLLAGRFGTRVPLLLDAATFVVMLLAALLLRTRRRVGRPAAGVKQRGGLAIVRSDAVLGPLIVLVGLFVLLGCMVNVGDVFLVREALGASTTWYGITGAAYAAGVLAGALLGGRLRPGRQARGFVASATVLALGLCAMGAVPSVGWLVPIGLVTGAANGVLNVALSAMVMGRAREAERGRVGAVLNGVASGTQLIAFAAGGALTGQLGPRAVFVLAGSLGVLAPLLLGRRLLRAADRDGADSAGMTPTPVAP